MRRLIINILVVCVLAMVASAPTAAQANANRLTVTDEFNLEIAADPQISSDGQRIIYVRQFNDVMSDKRYSNLWAINPDGSDHRPLTTGNYTDVSPRWSPDGREIIFISDRDGIPQIYRRWMDTGQTAKITNLTLPPSGVAWSSDGKWISFTSFVPAAPRQLIQMPAPPQGAKWADPARVVDKSVYRFDGAGYLPAGYSHVFVLAAEGGTPRQITSGNFNHGGTGFSPGEAVWLPDGKSLLVSANRRVDFEFEPLDSEIYEFAAADGAIKALTKRKGPDTSPAVSPDGKLIAYVGFDDQYLGYQITRLYVMSRDGSNPRAVTAGYDRDVARPKWAADSSGIYFLSDDQGNSGLYFTSLDGKVRKVTGNIGGGMMAYGGGTYSLAKNGAFAINYTRPNVPGDIAAGNVNNATTKVITSVNEDLFTGKQLGQVEEIWYESSKDRRKIQGWIIKPPGFDPSKKYPLILEIHGGPFANYGDRFDLEKQMMAAAGYVVVYTNPRGSTSYGHEFGNLIHHAYPGDDFFDLNSGVDAVIAKGYIDPELIYVTGGSGGGVLTCWMIGRSPRFRAAVTVYPVINWYSFALTADAGAFFYKYWFPGLPWDHVEHYEKRSLLSVVKNVKTPTMVLTGEEDHRTPMSESEQYYQALKLLGIEAVLVRVPGESHGIVRRPSHHISKMLHIIGWFDQHRRDTPVAGSK